VEPSDEVAELMWLKSHHWVDVPHTKYERRRELRVRESRHTVMLFDRKYLNIDTGKLNTDKLHSLYCTSLSEIIQDDYDGLNAQTEYKRRFKNESEKWFVPKDDNFDEECRLDEERKRHEEIKRIKKEREEKFAARMKEVAELRKHLEEQKIKREEEYQAYVQKREMELKLTQQKRAEIYQRTSVVGITIISKNCWKPK
jgi:hypothetical protein